MIFFCLDAWISLPTIMQEAKFEESTSWWQNIYISKTNNLLDSRLSSFKSSGSERQKIKKKKKSNHHKRSNQTVIINEMKFGKSIFKKGFVLPIVAELKRNQLGCPLLDANKHIQYIPISQI